MYDINGNEIKVVKKVPLTENIPKGFDSAPKGKREMEWRNDKSATLHYVVALDEGDKAIRQNSGMRFSCGAHLLPPNQLRCSKPGSDLQVLSGVIINMRLAMINGTIQGFKNLPY